MDKKYKKIYFTIDCKINEAVEELLSYKDNNILACGDFNGVTLYSDTVTLDNAYKIITGKTKDEFDEFQREWEKKWKEEYEKQEREHKEKIPELIKLWKQKGREVLEKDKWDYWDEIVPIRLNDIYHGKELGCCLNLIKILNNDRTFDEAKKEIYNQDHSGMSFALVCSMVRQLCSRGNEFIQYITNSDYSIEK